MNVKARRLVVSALAGATLAAVAVQSPAYAGEWAAPVAGCRIVFAYGAQYAGKTHRGVDLDACAGGDVMAPAAGTVSFAGQVPADGGGTCGAVTVELPDGLRVSLLPLQEVLVSAGDRVAEAEVVGTLAASGDDSTAAPHLHLGARRGTQYVDPTALLPPLAAAEPEPEPDAVNETAAPASDFVPTTDEAAVAPPVSALAPAAGAANAADPAVATSVAGVPAREPSPVAALVAGPEGVAACGAAGGVAPGAGDGVAALESGGADGERLGVGFPRAAGARASGHQLEVSPGVRWPVEARSVPEAAGLPAASSIAPAVLGARAWSLAVPALGGAGGSLPAMLAALGATLGLGVPVMQGARVSVRSR